MARRRSATRRACLRYRIVRHSMTTHGAFAKIESTPPTRAPSRSR
jgi:hypothetical protein